MNIVKRLFGNKRRTPKPAPLREQLLDRLRSLTPEEFGQSLRQAEKDADWTPKIKDAYAQVIKERLIVLYGGASRHPWIDYYREINDLPVRAQTQNSRSAMRPAPNTSHEQDTPKSDAISSSASERAPKYPAQPAAPMASAGSITQITPCKETSINRRTRVRRNLRSEYMENQPIGVGMQSETNTYVGTTPLTKYKPQRGQKTSLNPEQRRAVETMVGPVLIIAGPGSGKTRVIIERIAHMVENGVLPSQIMAVTFTNKAAEEMKRRLTVSLGEQARPLTLGTFHRFCGATLRRFGTSVGIPRNFAIYDRDDQRVAMQRAMGLAGLDLSPRLWRPLVNGVSRAKSCLISPEDYLKKADEYATENVYWKSDAPFKEQIAAVYPHYQSLLESSNALDFDDMIVQTVKMLEGVPSAKEAIHRQYQYLMVDEFQDTDPAQFRLLQILSEQSNNICVVGDPDQSIYGWRNAEISNIMTFEEKFSGTRRIYLGQNYRSTKNIVRAAANLIEKNTERFSNPLSTTRTEGPEVQIIENSDSSEEAMLVITKLRSLVEKERNWNDCAIAYRTNRQSRPLEEFCIRQQIPYRLIGGIPFYQRKEIKDCLAYLKVINNPGDDVATQRIINLPPRRIGNRTVKALLERAEANDCTLMQAAVNASDSDLGARAKTAISAFNDLMQELPRENANLTVTKLLDLVLSKTHLDEYIQKSDNGQERWENVLELRAATEQFGVANSEDGLSAFLEQATLFAENKVIDLEMDELTLVTLHRVKGLEFDSVAIVGCRDGILPLGRAEDIEEERRLFYVGITRAKNELYLACPQDTEEVSRFISELQK